MRFSSGFTADSKQQSNINPEQTTEQANKQPTLTSNKDEQPTQTRNQRKHKHTTNANKQTYANKQPNRQTNNQTNNRTNFQS
jgi:hypothetical protein